MKISVSPIPKGNVIDKYIDSEKLNRAYSDCEKKNSENKMKAIKRIFVPHINNLRKKVMRNFYDIGFKVCRCETDLKTDIRFQSYLMGSKAKDLVFHSLEDAKDWLVSADAWKE